MSRSTSAGTEPAPTLAAAVAGARIIFVVGKGGVGKSTTAAALALELAGATRVHLISTDPAHSTGDVFGSGRITGTVPSSCTPSLALEELDADAAAAAWVERARAPVTAIVERGTYLDAEDVAGFLRLALPGLDETMAVLRLVELERGGDLVVVDTAPTGHTLRLLDAAATHEGLALALRAMADKAAAVASSLARTTVRLAAESFIRELESQVSSFRERVLGAARFVLVTQPDPPVAAETLRFAAELRSRGLHVAATVTRAADGQVAQDARELREGGAPNAPAIERDHAIAAADGAPCFFVPELHAATGCQGLRDWYAAVVPCGADQSNGPARVRSTHSSRAPAPGGGPPRSAAPWLAALRLRLLLFAGKGGVGKTTCAAATALLLSRDRDVLLCSADPAGSLDDVFGRNVTSAGRATPPLRVAQVEAQVALAEVRARYREDVLLGLERIGLGAAAALDRRVVERVLDLAPPGIDELAALATLLDASRSHETIVLDAAPTGHFLRLLTMPALALDWTRQLVRIMVKYGAAGGDGGAAAALLRTARELRSLQELLRDPARAGVFIVALDQPVVRAETDRLRHALELAGVPVAARITNRVGPPDDRRRDVVPAGAHAGLEPEPHVEIAAPLRAPAVVGEDALRAFVETWSMVG
jgi:arsenite/tail-anchored protein-transporting ATPase